MRALTLHATAFHPLVPNQVGGLIYDESTDLWHGIIEDGYVAVMKANWKPYENEDSTQGTVDTLQVNEILFREGLKAEGIERVPSCATSSLFLSDPEYWVVSESFSETKVTSSYFSKRHGQPDLNTFEPGSFRDSHLMRVSSTGEVLEEVHLPEWLMWDGTYDWDPRRCHGTRVWKGLHDLGFLPADKDNDVPASLATYQDGPEPTMFEGSHVRIMLWDVTTSMEPKEGGGCSSSLEYSRTYRYRTAPLQITTFQKGARHLRAIMAMLAVSPTEFIVAETEILEGFGITKFVSDVFYVKINSTDDTVDHCDSLMDCDGVEVPVKHHLLRRDNGMELGDIAWGPKVKRDGVELPTVAIVFETDDYGILMEQYTLNMTALELSPSWENDQSDPTVFVRQRVSVLAAALALFFLGFFLQIWWVRRQNAKAMRLRGELRRDATSLDITNRLEYKDYVLASAVINSCLLGGIVFGFPGLVLILRREGIHAEVCSCGVFCAGQQEKLSIISTMGFAAAIGSRLFSGVFLDKFGPKVTAVLSGIVSTSGLIVLATAKDTSVLTKRIDSAWIILAVGGASMHLTSFHVTNLQASPSEKRKASLWVSAGFGAGSLVLPVLQVINQYGDVKLQTICMVYSCVTVLLTLNSFFVQPWRAWNAIGSQATLDTNCLRRLWWPSSILELTAIKKKTSKKFPPLKSVLRSFTFWGECAWFSSQLFLLTYYLSTINQILFALGDATVNQNVDSLLNNMFTRACVFFNGFGWLWSPIVGYLMATKSIYFRIYLEIAMALVMSLLLTVPVIEVQLIVFMLQALVRLQVFSNHFSYLGERFGFRHFGLLNGISSLVAGAFGLLGYTLQIYSLFIAKGNFSLSYFMVAVLVVASSLFPYVLKQKDRSVIQKDDVHAGEQIDETVDSSSFDAFLEFLYGSRWVPSGYEAFQEFLYGPSEEEPQDETKVNNSITSTESSTSDLLMQPVGMRSQTFQ